MMAEKVIAWKSSDGEMFENEDDAKAHDFETELMTWVNKHSPFPSNTQPFTTILSFVDAMVEDRMALLKIFKLLNGGNPIVAAPTKEITDGI